MDVRLLKENFMIDDRSNLKYAANSVAETKEISEQEKQSERKQIINKAEDKQKNESLSQNNYTEDHIIVKAPMLGTFFRKPSPDEPVYAEVGDVVEAADTVCLIEVMKLFNSISAGKKGRIADILVSDGEMVEYDQPLFVLEPI
ncbi:acetyl-CoA carboxylase, biotin carboxyl carrier protein [Paenibacillus thalictri]|uniref:Biotin carboxyl carrier protein of acetyl-CoA carboxylase n=2 Tax=Paenibacillus thalictri TaxID=2527873 RepID=A0A4Q9DWB6_9BACL|nr:acetyl-CoA carboxylase, biotin carboxyl carrier protein [Paenibacillus thalictri]